MHAPCFQSLLFDPFPLLQYGFVPSEIAIGRCNVVQAVVAELVVIVIDESFDLGLELTEWETVFQ